MRNAVITPLAVVLLVAFGLFLTGCPARVSDGQGERAASGAGKKGGRTGGEGQSMAGREGGGKGGTSESIRESILRSERDVPPQLSARGKEFSPADLVLRTINFEFDKSALTDQAINALKGNAEWLQANSEAEVLIEGHADERGTDEYNLALGERRAMSVRRYLIALGIDPVRLYTISFGEERPLTPGHDEPAWAKNRRAQFQVTTY